MIVNITKENFEKEIINSEIPVLADFWAPWCSHCVNLTPTIEEISQEREGEIKVCKINIDETPEIASMFGVMSIPTCIRFDGGKAVKQTLGAMPKDALLMRLGF